MNPIIHSAWSMLYHLDARDSVPSLWNTARLLFKRRDHELAAKRLAACRHCPLFNSERQTCGTVPETMPDPFTKRPVPLGCWCYLPIAAAIPSKDCWARANDLDVGWPDHLRPSP